MRITDLISTQIAIGDPPLLNAAGLHAPYALRIIVEVVTDQGFVGLSEIPGSDRTYKAMEELKPHLIGMDVFQFNAIKNLIREKLGGVEDSRGETPWDQRLLVHLFSAIEVACLDCIGKKLNKPVVDLLGGRSREKVPFSAYLFYKYEGAGGDLGFEVDHDQSGWLKARQEEALSPKQIVSQARAMCEEFGFQSIKLKGGVKPPEEEYECILALREEFGPNVPLRLDPNALWSLKTATKYGKKLEGLLEYFEDPVRGQEEMGQLAKRINIPLATNMCTTSFEDIPQSIALESERIILSDHHFWGGLRACIELNRICHTLGRGFSMHSNSHVGISMAAMVHLGAAVPHLDYALDTHYPWQVDEVIKGGKIKIENGFVDVLEGPGLGVELDRDQLQRLHQQFLNSGLKERNDEIEMKKVDPQWEFKLQRW
ncbi:glucarate dehydratase [Flagellimonas olearia]|uniref:glucarate dehydratase n=1 Tax=Flagellimonas olearia TaxID=552546 RepID=A0A6I1E6M1_9FLAO|nr:enolase C-terminal domain-like protein [Allomuricauda olearia]KAB7531500.1 glucarate dehydratase [Allomuricauda olearia]